MSLSQPSESGQNKNNKQWQSVTPDAPCPACGGTSQCAWAPDGRTLRCWGEVTTTPEGMRHKTTDKDGAQQYMPDEGEADKAKKQISQADLCVELAQNVELFHAGGDDPVAYASIDVGEHRETWPVHTKGFRRWLYKAYYDAYGKAPNAQAVQDALNVLAGQAMYDGPERPVAVRLADYRGRIYLDLCDSEWRAVQIDAEGWRVVNSNALPVRFIRKRGQQPLPVPESGGSIEELRPLVNLPDDDQWRLFVAWLVAAFRPVGPYPILTVNGEQGSAKSTLCRFGRALIDPNQSPLRRPPSDERDLMIAAQNGWTVAYDNLSGIAPNLSDALCSLATGGGFSTRELYSDDEEKLFAAQRPVMLNGIDELATRPDLLDRALQLTLPTIPDEQRTDENELHKRFEDAWPRILGALLDAVSEALANHDTTKLDRAPRMADFARWIVAAERARIHRAGVAEDDLPPLVTEARETLADLGAELVSIDAGPMDWAKRASALIASLNDEDQRVAARDHFEERAAICEWDGGLSRQDAEALAYREIRERWG